MMPLPTLEQIKELQEYKLNMPSLSVKEKPLEIILKPEILDTSKLQIDNSKNLWRPTSFSEYVGQEETKERLNDYIQGCLKFKEQFPHTFISAPSGCGKTTLAYILANILKKKFVSCTAGEIKTEQQIVDKICECEGGIIFLDEAHRISTKIGTFLLPVLEDFKIQDKQIRKFSMIMATTHAGNIAKNLEALVQRFGLRINLKHYEIEDLIQILKQYQAKQYSQISVMQGIFLSIAENCRRTPRIALNLLKEYVYTSDLKRVFKNNNIIQDGITLTDIQLLKYLQLTGGAGKNSLAKYLRVEPNTIEFEIEPYLIFKELVVIASKRKITEKGKEFLKGI